MVCRPGDPSVGGHTAHADELARFESNVVRGPGADDCAICAGAVGADGYGQSTGMNAPRGGRWQ